VNFVCLRGRKDYCISGLVRTILDVFFLENQDAEKEK